MGRKKITDFTINERLLLSHNGSVSLVQGSFVGMKEKATFKHILYGDWYANANSVINQGSNHPKTQLDALKWSKDDFEIALHLIHGDSIKIIWDTWVGSRDKATFIHSEYGEFLATPDNILRGRSHPSGESRRIKETNLSRYGVEFPSQNKEIALKTAKKLNDSSILKHWKTNEDIVCRASYEVAVINHLNRNKVEYRWQPEIFNTPLITAKGNKTTYCPDLFLVNENKWIEIKGWFRGDALSKWNWFKTQFPTAELWDKKKLKEMGIL